MKKIFKKKKTICITMVLFACIMWLISSNFIIAGVWNFSHNVRLTKHNQETIYDDIDTSISYAVDYCHVTNDMLDIYAINGWVFCENAGTDVEKDVGIVLQSEDRTYYINADLYQRVDNMLGYGIEISLLGVKPGIYNIVLVYLEDETIRAYASTKQYVEINAKGISEWKYTSTVYNTEGIEAMYSDSLSYDPGIKVTDDRIELWGWVLDEGKDSSQQEVIISLEDENGEMFYYQTMPIERTAVADIYGSPLYNMSGFWAGVNGENMANKEWIIKLYIRQGEEWYQPNNYFVYNPETQSISWINGKYEASMNDKM